MEKQMEISPSCIGKISQFADPPHSSQDEDRLNRKIYMILIVDWYMHWLKHKMDTETTIGEPKFIRRPRQWHAPECSTANGLKKDE